MKIPYLVALLSFCLSLITPLFVSPAYGHAGHMHNHWSADMLHYGFYISMAVMIIVVMYCMVRLLTADSDDQRLRHKSNSQV